MEHEDECKLSWHTPGPDCPTISLAHAYTRLVQLYASVPTPNKNLWNPDYATFMCRYRLITPTLYSKSDTNACVLYSFLAKYILLCILGDWGGVSLISGLDSSPECGTGAWVGTGLVDWNVGLHGICGTELDWNVGLHAWNVGLEHYKQKLLI